LQRSPEVRKRERRHIITESLRYHFIIEGSHRLAQLRKQIALTAGAVGNRRVSRSFVRMRVKTPERTEENLSLHRNSDRVFYLDELGDLLQLISQRRSRKRGCERWVGLIQRRVGRQSLTGCIAGGLDQRGIQIITEQRSIAAAAIVWICRRRSAPV